LKELSLFTGAGGGVLGSKLLGWTTIGYVEYEKYCQKILKQRIADGILDAAPIFGDIRKFISEGYAEAYKDMVDVISAGFPCQPFSVAGKGLGEDDPRNMWPATIECIRIIRPRYCLLENVPGLLIHDYIKRIFGDLAESGYDVRWTCLSAAACGAPHLRNRLWIVGRAKTERPGAALADADGNREKRNQSQNRQGSGSKQSGWWRFEPDVGRVAHGVAARMDRLKALGNGQVPQVVKTAWELLK